MNFQKNKVNICVVCFYLASKGGNGAAEVTLGLYNSISKNKKLFEIDDKNFKNRISNFFFKILNICSIVFKIKNLKKNLLKI